MDEFKSLIAAKRKFIAPAVIFFIVIVITLYITWRAARRSAGSSAYFAAGRSLTAWRNGVAVAASAYLPVIVLSLFWRRFNARGAVAGLATGLLASLILILLSLSIMKDGAIFPLENPGIVSIPLGFCRIRRGS